MKRQIGRHRANETNLLLLLLIAGFAQSSLADAPVEQAQQALKEQGFYYGEVTGQKNADTTAAIRRFQIRNGLQVTGELNEETQRALRLSNSSAAAAPTATPPPSASFPAPDAKSAGTPATQPVAPNSPAVPAVGGDLFRDTPYDVAPLAVQRRVIRGAQTLLRRQGYYKGEIDGIYGPELEFSLRAYQSSVRILASGRLDMDTLGSLGLLPGQEFRPGGFLRRRIAPRLFGEPPPVRGQWIPENPDRDNND